MGKAKERLHALAEAMADRLEPIQRIEPKLRLVKSEPTFDDITREAMASRIRDLRRMYGLGWLVRQETFHVPGIEFLEDAELSALLRDMERARECITEDVSFEDAGLVRSRELEQ